MISVHNILLGSTLGSLCTLYIGHYVKEFTDSKSLRFYSIQFFENILLISILSPHVSTVL